jgi:subtilisin family serine protease
MKTEIADSGRIVVIDTLSIDTPQAFTVCVKDPSDWQEIHNYIINENEIDGIPNRSIDCISDLPFSPKRSVYSMSSEESDILKTHPKIEWIEKSSLYNPEPLEQRKYDEEFDRHIDTNRFKQNILNIRTTGNPGAALTFTQWGLLRHQSRDNSGFGTNTTVSSDIQYSLTGKHVDVVIMDTGVRWDHPEFLNSGYTSVPVGVSTISVTRVRDILLHGPSEYGFTWSANGLTAPGSGLLANYTEATALNSSSFNGSWHGSHVAGTSAGNQFGTAFEANIWSIACVDRSDLGWAEPSDGFDYIRVWHNNKPVNPITGVKNPTVVNCSWGHRQFVSYNDAYTATFRGNSYSSTYTEASGNNVPAIYYMKTNSTYYEFTTKRTSGQTQVDEILDDLGCQNVILICSAGNSGSGNGKQDVSGGLDYDNQFTSGTFFYSSGYDTYYCRNGTPAIGHIGLPDAVIKVGAMDSTVVTSGVTSERKASYSNTGPTIDVWSAGTNVLSPYSSGYADPRSGITTFYNDYLSGTSMASPNVTGVVALYLQTNPRATRVDVRNWLNNNATIDIGTGFLDAWSSNDAVGVNSVSYWSDSYGLRDSNHKILYNPFANNTIPSISGVSISGISFTQS